MQNYYEILGITPAASAAEISAAIKKAAERQALDLDVLTACRNHLFDNQARQAYNQQLFAARPELLEEVALEAQARAAATAEREARQAVIAANPPKKTSLIMIFGGGFILLFLLATIFSNKSPQKTTLSEFSAQAACQDVITDRLKAPSSAKFGGWQHKANGGGSYTVSGYVDAQNSFGAPLRNHFSCAVRDNGNGNAGITINGFY